MRCWREETIFSLLYGGRQVALIFAIKPTTNWAKENPYMGHADERKTVDLQPEELFDCQLEPGMLDQEEKNSIVCR